MPPSGGAASPHKPTSSEDRIPRTPPPRTTRTSRPAMYKGPFPRRSPEKKRAQKEILRNPDESRGRATGLARITVQRVGTRRFLRRFFCVSLGNCLVFFSSFLSKSLAPWVLFRWLSDYICRSAILHIIRLLMPGVSSPITTIVKLTLDVTAPELAGDAKATYCGASALLACCWPGSSRARAPERAKFLHGSAAVRLIVVRRRGGPEFLPVARNFRHLSNVFLLAERFAFEWGDFPCFGVRHRLAQPSPGPRPKRLSKC